MKRWEKKVLERVLKITHSVKGMIKLLGISGTKAVGYKLLHQPELTVQGLK